MRAQRICAGARGRAELGRLTWEGSQRHAAASDQDGQRIRLPVSFSLCVAVLHFFFPVYQCRWSLCGFRLIFCLRHPHVPGKRKPQVTLARDPGHLLARGAGTAPPAGGEGLVHRGRDSPTASPQFHLHCLAFWKCGRVPRRLGKSCLHGCLCYLLAKEGTLCPRPS